MKLLVNIVGAGHLGKTIGNLLLKHQLVTIGGICNTSKISAESAIKFIGGGTYYPAICELPSADITFITTPDDLIKQACDELSKNPFLKQENIVLHCSGSLTSDTLNSASNKGCFVASVHPMRSFAKPELSIEEYQGTYCAMEGDEKSLPILKSLFEKIGSITYQIDKSKKSLYHAAGVFSSNYLVTLAQQALTCMQESGVETEIAMHIITNLMKGSISNLEKTLSPKQSLTGPIQRGDVSTIEKHMDALYDEDRKILYSSLGRATLALTTHKHEKKEIIEKALTTDVKKDPQQPHLFF
ncbi:Rossmann-like and DUF2520 domain-containing protein [Legionella sp.]|uniref:Rossmann-like and DUF2520 domain-containing protein n=1 Tax=Legionella sp. TaxID=459 RepID=UPI003CC0665E